MSNASPVERRPASPSPWELAAAAIAVKIRWFGLLYLMLPADRRQAFPLALTLVMLGWVTWASNALAMLLKSVGEYLGQLNTALKRQQVELEHRIAERTAQLQESQAHVLHQEKMA